MGNNRLSGKTALVTGASKGIGAGIARALGAEGASVVVNYAGDKKGAEATAAAILEAGGKAVAVQGDVSRAADVKRLLDESEKAFGKLDILVNNAGVFAFTPIAEVKEEDFQRQFGINVWGLLQTTREALPHLKDGASVINISSIVSRMGIPGSAIYAATKGAVDTITQVLASELGPRRIRVNSINPGLTESEGTHTAGFIGGDFQKHSQDGNPLGRIGQPEDIAKVAVFLASDDSAWLTGERISASGGSR